MRDELKSDVASVKDDVAGVNSNIANMSSDIMGAMREMKMSSEKGTPRSSSSCSRRGYFTAEPTFA